MSSKSTSVPLPPDVSRGSDLLIVAWLNVSVAVLFVSLRFYIRGILRKNLGWDDYIILIANAFAITESIFATFQVQSGFGRNIQYLTTVQLQHFGRYTNAYILLHVIGIGLVRISVCLFVLDLVPTIKRSYHRWIWGLLALNTIVSLTDFFALCFQCIPLAGLWDKSIKARCFAHTTLVIFARIQGSAAIATDLLCVLLPMFVFRNLQVSARDKIAIYVVLGLGFFTTATAVVRTALLNLTSPNPTWDFIPIAIWACLEINTGIIVASIPALRQLFTIRKTPYPSNSTKALYNHQNNNTHTFQTPFARLSERDRIRLSDYDCSTETNSCEFSSLEPKTSEVESCHDQRASPVRLSTASPPAWTERKISLTETVEVISIPKAHNPSSAEKVRPSVVAPSRGHRKTSSIDKLYHRNNFKRLEIISPVSLDRPASPFTAARAPQLGRFEETGLRHSRVATPEQMMSLGNPAALGYSCKIEGGTPTETPKTSPNPSPKFAP